MTLTHLTAEELAEKIEYTISPYLHPATAPETRGAIAQEIVKLFAILSASQRGAAAGEDK